MGHVTEALRRFRDRVVTPDAVYGTILFAALIAVASRNEDLYGVVVGDEADGDPATTEVDPFVVLVAAGSALVVFWIAHVYARTIARHGVRDGQEIRLGESFRDALGDSMGMLTAAVPSTVILILGAIGIVPNADGFALMAAIVVLFVLGYQSMAERGSGVGWRLLGGLVSSLLGFVVVVLDIAVH